MLLIPLGSLGQRLEVPALDGKWSSPAQMLDEEAWRFEDYACFLGCSLETFQFARNLFSNDENFDRSLGELMGVVLGRRMQDIMAQLTPAARQRAASFDLADDPVIRCEPYGLVRQALSPGAIGITQSDDTVTIDYEVWEARRVVQLDAQASDAERSRLGYSVGRYDDGALVVHTAGVSEDFIAAGLGAIHSGGLRAVERYSVSEDGSRLDLEMTLNDPVALAEPITFRAAWRRTPDAEFLPWNCELLGDPQ